MNNIGQKIKELRRKNDLTQEKLADFLGVTYQSVSKWETGTTYPDLGMIVPLAKLLHVTTDELLGLNPEDIDAKRAEYEDRYAELGKKGDMESRKKLLEEAMREFPGDTTWLNRYAWDIWCDACTKIGTDDEAYIAGCDRAIKLFDTVIENTDDDEVKAHAIEGIVQCLCRKGLRAEAKRYVDLFPVSSITHERRNDLLGQCLEGEERITHKQKWLNEQLYNIARILLWANPSLSEPAIRGAEGIIKSMITDGNYCTYHYELAHIKVRLAQIAAREGREEDAMAELTLAIYHAKEYDKIDSVEPGEYRFTTPLLDHVTFNSGEWYRVDNSRLTDDIIQITERKDFDVLRERTDFKCLIN